MIDSDHHNVTRDSVLAALPAMRFNWSGPWAREPGSNHSRFENRSCSNSGTVTLIRLLRQDEETCVLIAN